MQHTTTPGNELPMLEGASQDSLTANMSGYNHYFTQAGVTSTLNMTSSKKPVKAHPLN